jgi:hypothetical protein
MLIGLACRYISNIEMPGGKIVYVPLQPPASGATQTTSAADWTIDYELLEKAITPKTKMIVINTPRMFASEVLKSLSFVFLTEMLQITRLARSSPRRSCRKWRTFASRMKSLFCRMKSTTGCTTCRLHALPHSRPRLSD